MHKHMHTCMQRIQWGLRDPWEASLQAGFYSRGVQQNLISIHRTESLTPPTLCPHSPEKLLWLQCSPHQSLHPQVALSLNSLYDFSGSTFWPFGDESAATVTLHPTFRWLALCLGTSCCPHTTTASREDFSKPTEDVSEWIWINTNKLDIYN